MILSISLQKADLETLLRAERELAVCAVSLSGCRESITEAAAALATLRRRLTVAMAVRQRETGQARGVQS